MLQPQAYHAHTMLMNMIHSTGTYATIHLSDFVVTAQWLHVQEVVVTTVLLMLLADSQTVQRQEIPVYLCQLLITTSLQQKSCLSRKHQVREA